jgi:cellulose synthase/poly-beta-1,6-N-acetylglucosamine synthase-like glycosyltransferase
MPLVPILLVTAVGMIVLPTTIFFLELIAAALLGRRARAPQSDCVSRPRIAVLVPAHNESRSLRPTIADIRPQLHPGDRLVVVVDNCSDDTAEVAVDAGAEIVERKDLTKVGKGYALDWGVRYLGADPPSIVIIVDADCRLSADTLDQLVCTTSATGRPTQALNLMMAPVGSSINYRVAEFAWRVKNWVRPLGLHALNSPCQLLGTGMAFPWEVIRAADLATGHIVEDLKLGLDLAASGHPPLFCPAAIVKSSFPPTLTGATSQRERWEHGHVGLTFTQAPRLIFRALKSGNVDLLVLALDISVPPLTLLGYLNGFALLTTSLAALCGVGPLALYASAVSFTAFLVAVLLAWLTHGRDVLPAHSIALLGSYIFAKLGLYLRLLRHGPISRWTRTDRQ